MLPAIGRIVLYTLTDYDAAAINGRRDDAAAFRRSVTVTGPLKAGEIGRTGHVEHAGNAVSEGDVLPATIARTFEGTYCNLQVTLDGNDTWWATSRQEGDGPGFWSWPARAEAARAEDARRASVGRIVHYVSYGTPDGEYGRECRAAIVTEVSHANAPDGQGQPQAAGLCVLNPAGQFFSRDVGYDNGQPDTMGGTSLCAGLDYAGGTWHWPART